MSESTSVPQNRSLVTGRTSHQIYVLEDGKRRWIPDLWTMHAIGLSPADLVILDDDELEASELSDAIPSEVPTPELPEGGIIESENDVFIVQDGRLVIVDNPQTLLTGNGFDPSKVTWLPESVIRSMQ
ncbi:hypothetical protein [Arthrobacter sp. 2MCAF14]|uniref:hypothetical protein n=1 Tax=Arthrobacter sp. 2MCAF14 TaxID=3232982 RepID=UPI003F906751